MTMEIGLVLWKLLKENAPKWQSGLGTVVPTHLKGTRMEKVDQIGCYFALQALASKVRKTQINLSLREKAE